MHSYSESLHAIVVRVTIQKEMKENQSLALLYNILNQIGSSMVKKL